jgi:ABC-type Mn2+/Zn2+ transport system permease subunit
MSARWTTRWLVFAAAWNILGGVSALWNPPAHFAQLYTTTLQLGDPLTLFFYRCTWINVIAWGIAYALAAAMTESRRAVLMAGAIGKTVYCAASVAVYLAGAGTAALLAAGAVDLLLALAFVFGFFAQQPRRYQDEAGRPYITRL